MSDYTYLGIQTEVEHRQKQLRDYATRYHLAREAQGLDPHLPGPPLADRLADLVERLKDAVRSPRFRPLGPNGRLTPDPT
jgi:hypothetical protein